MMGRGETHNLTACGSSLLTLDTVVAAELPKVHKTER